MSHTSMDPEEFRAEAHRVVDWIADYWRELPSRPVQTAVKPGRVTSQLPPSPPATAEPFSAVMEDLDQILLPAMTHWQHPSFFGYFPANTSGPSVLGDLLSAGLNVQGMLWSTSPAATELETTVCEWLRQLLDLPGAYRGNGVVQSTATTAFLMAITAALSRAGGADWRQEGDTRAYTCYTSDQANVMVQRVCRVVGIGDRRLRRIPSDPTTLALQPEALEQAIRADLAAGLRPAMVVATVGTTSTCAVDPLPRIGEICARHGLWLHVDAAYAGVAAVCPEYRWIHDGVAWADSYSTSPHKWLLTGFDCSVLWLSDPEPLMRATSAAADYLDTDPDACLDLGNWQLPLGRRFRSLKLWSVLRCHGQQGLRAHIRRGVAHAQAMSEHLRSDGRFEPAAPQRLGLVCFRLRAGDAATTALADRLNSSGRMFVTTTRVNGRAAVRLAAGGLFTRDEHIDEAWRHIRATADSILAADVTRHRCDGRTSSPDSTNPKETR
ncbi:pyridoxal-dependent decarboxylase [Streptomyces sp. NPDC050803]|uniref:pyridoxal phosphate-dependent decarboxylase family protein n=1 Tax=unclassified Streptomyces TaxID=2593676 RepID=UPI00343C43C2